MTEESIIYTRVINRALAKLRNKKGARVEETRIPNTPGLMHARRERERAEEIRRMARVEEGGLCFAYLPLRGFSAISMI